MSLLPYSLVFALNANGVTSRIHAARGENFDPWPVVKLFSPVGAATWIATEFAEDGDTLFGLADLGFGCPELGYFSLREIRSVRLPFGLVIERDRYFDPLGPLSTWTDEARRLGSIVAAERVMRRRKSDRLLPDPTPTPDEGGDGEGS